MIVIGIDPGVETGRAVWSIPDKRFLEVKTAGLLATFEALAHWRAVADLRLVIFEDARLRTWFGTSGSEKWQGVGSIKRDCTLWEDYLTRNGIPYRAKKPAPGATKWNAEHFKRLTGWEGVTNEHNRDAGCLVVGYTAAMVQSNLVGSAHHAKPAGDRPQNRGRRPRAATGFRDRAPRSATTQS